MIELAFVVCLIADPTRCKEVNQQFMAEAVTPQQCMMNGEVAMSKWINEHPGWRVTKWTCGRPRVKA